MQGFEEILSDSTYESEELYSAAAMGRQSYDVPTPSKFCEPIASCNYPGVACLGCGFADRSLRLLKPHPAFRITGPFPSKPTQTTFDSCHGQPFPDYLHSTIQTNQLLIQRRFLALFIPLQYQQHLPQETQEHSSLCQSKISRPSVSSPLLFERQYTTTV
jgi:hypothetical protein